MDYSKPFLGKEVKVKVDRPLGSAHPKWGFVYPVNYGYVPDTRAPDGEELDAYILGVNEPVNEFTGICRAVIHRVDDDDDKLVIMPHDFYCDDDKIRELTDFQEKFFKSYIIR